MGSRRLGSGLVALAALGLATLASAQGQTGDSASDVIKRRLQRMMSGGPMMDPPELSAALATASAFPLGSRDNPIRAESPKGQRAYLSRLRCADGHAPYFSRIGNVGPGVFQSIVDDYAVDCGTSAPGQVHIMMDMYFKGYVEDRAVPGFSILPETLQPAPAPLAPAT